MLVIMLNCVTLGMFRPCEDVECRSERCSILKVGIWVGGRQGPETQRGPGWAAGRSQKRGGGLGGRRAGAGNAAGAWR